MTRHYPSWRHTRRILALLDIMPEPERSVFLRHRVEATPLRSIAHDLNVPLGEVERLLANAMLHLDTPPSDGAG